MRKNPQLINIYLPLLFKGSENESKTSNKQGLEQSQAMCLQAPKLHVVRRTSAEAMSIQSAVGKLKW